MSKITKKSLISLLIAIIMILNLVPFGAISKVYATEKTDLTNVTISSEGVISWDAYEGATDYWYSFGTGGGYSGGTSINLYESARDWLFASGTYNIRIVALNSSKEEISNEWNGTYDYIAPFPKLETPTNLHWDGYVAKWDAVEYANNYNVIIHNVTDDSDISATQKNITSTQYDFSTEVSLLKGKQYTFKVIAIDNSENKRPYSDTATCSTPIEGWYERGTLSNVELSSEGVLSWDSYEGATDYWYTLSSGGGYTGGTNLNLKEKAIDFELDSGVYTVKIIALNSEKEELTNAYEFNYNYTKSYRVDFETNGGNDVESQFIESGNQATVPQNPTKLHYKFVGWYKDSELTEEYDFDTPITENKNIYAKWDEIITTADCTITKPVEGETPDFSPIPLDNEKYSINRVHWYLNESPYPTLESTDTFQKGKEYSVRIDYIANSGYCFENSTEYKINGEETGCYGGLYQREITYLTIPVSANTVIFNTNGGSLISNQEIESGEKVIKPVTNPTKDGYIFAGWYSDEELTIEYDFNTPVTSDITIYAKWVLEEELISEANCTITTPKAGENADRNPISEDSTKYIVTLGYWYLREEPYPTLTEENTFESGKKYSLRLIFSAKAGYKFDETTVFKVNGIETSSYGIIGNRELDFEIPYTVTFDINGVGDTAPNSIDVIKGGIFAPPAEPTAKCFDFAGWYKDKELTQIYEFETDTVTDNITLYAKWTPHHSNIIPVLAKSATCKETGNNAYYKCNYCGKVFKDAEGMQETTVEAETIEKTAHTLNSEYVTNITKATLSKDGSINTNMESKCSVCGEVVGGKGESTPIYYPKTISLSKTSFTYNKKVQKPTVTVKGSDGKTISALNYSVTYSNEKSKKIGEYTVTITFKGNYEGTKKLTYKINPKGTSLKKLAKGKKQFKVTWKAQKTETSGYEVQYSTNKNFKSGNKKVTIKKNKTTSTTVKKLKAKKKYYVRIRTYKTVKGKKYYSGWSKVLNVKTK